jgi:hypothetical protein
MPTSKNSPAGRDRAPANAITPELALVSPELAKTARGRLPDRPWEIEAEGESPSRRTRPRSSTANSRAQRERRVRAVVAAAVVVVALGVAALGIDGDDAVSPEGARSPATSPDTQAGATRRLLLPSAGYVVTPSGSFMTDASGRAIGSFTLPLRCGSRPLVVESIPVSGQSIRYNGRAMGGTITVRLTGRILDREHVRGVVVARGPSCSSDPVAFRARLS